MKRAIKKEDILPFQDFEQVRDAKKNKLKLIKKIRRIPVGPYVMFYFENYETIWWQIQEMLRIEQGGDEQLNDELAAYGPLVPKGNNLVATFMIEISDPILRKDVLKKLSYIENNIVMRFAGYAIKAQSTEDFSRTTDDGKTSSVHFLNWVLTHEQIKAFKEKNQDIVIDIIHPEYEYKTIMIEDMRLSLAQDLDLKYVD